MVGSASRSFVDVTQDLEIARRERLAETDLKVFDVSLQLFAVEGSSCLGQVVRIKQRCPVVIDIDSALLAVRGFDKDVVRVPDPNEG